MGKSKKKNSRPDRNDSRKKPSRNLNDLKPITFFLVRQITSRNFFSWQTFSFGLVISLIELYAGNKLSAVEVTAIHYVLNWLRSNELNFNLVDMLNEDPDDDLDAEDWGVNFPIGNVDQMRSLFSTDKVQSTGWLMM